LNDATISGWQLNPGVHQLGASSHVHSRKQFPHRSAVNCFVGERSREAGGADDALVPRRAGSISRPNKVGTRIAANFNIAWSPGES
jgi:hypothetical protein